MDNTVSCIDLFNSPLTDFVYAIIDTRSTAEFADGHIPTAICARDYVSFEELRNAILDMGYINLNKLVVYGDLEDIYTQELMNFFDSHIRELRTLEGGYNAFKQLFPGIVDPSGDYANYILPAYIPIANVYLGGAISANQKVLSGLHVKAILNVGAYEVRNEGLSSKFNYMYIDIEDMNDVQLEPHLSEGLHFIRTHHPNGAIYIHCSQGMSRSVSFVVALLMRYYDMSYWDALTYVKKCRPIARPNSGFEAQLRAMTRVV